MDSILDKNVSEEEGVKIRNEYNDQNRLIYSGSYIQNNPIGIHRYYHPDGEVVDAKIYNDKGKIISEGIVDNEGRRMGNWKDYYTTGELKAVGQYEGNLKTGRWIYYRRNKKVEQTGDFSRGRITGIWNWFYEDGSLSREEEFFNGKEDGRMIEYSLKSRIITEV